MNWISYRLEWRERHRGPFGVRWYWMPNRGYCQNRGPSLGDSGPRFDRHPMSTSTLVARGCQPSCWSTSENSKRQKDWRPSHKRYGLLRVGPLHRPGVDSVDKKVHLNRARKAISEISITRSIGKILENSLLVLYFSI